MQCLDSCLPDPRSDYCWSQIKILKEDFKDIPQKQCVDMLAEQFERVNLDKKTQSNDTLSTLEKLDKPEKSDGLVVSLYACEICKATYKAEGYLKKHMAEKHGLGGGTLVECTECGSFLSSKQALEKHILRNHRLCKICKAEFQTENEKDMHQKMHTTCNHCNTILPTVSKLIRHMTQVHGQ